MNTMYGHNSGAREEFELADDEVELFRSQAHLMLKADPENKNIVVSSRCQLDEAGREIMDDYTLDKKTEKRPRAARYYWVFDFEVGEIHRQNQARHDSEAYKNWSYSTSNSRVIPFSDVNAQERVYLEVARKIWRRANNLSEESSIK